jgi:hypothetical protein
MLDRRLVLPLAIQYYAEAKMGKRIAIVHRE